MYTCIRSCTVCRGLDAEDRSPSSGQLGVVLSRACCAEAVPLLSRLLLVRAWSIAPVRCTAAGADTRAKGLWTTCAVRARGVAVLSCAAVTSQLSGWPLLHPHAAPRHRSCSVHYDCGSAALKTEWHGYGCIVQCTPESSPIHGIFCSQGAV